MVRLRLAALFCLVALVSSPDAAANQDGQSGAQGEQPEYEFARLAPGSFNMGSLADEPGRDVDEKPREVTLSSAFEIGTKEVTLELYEAVMGERPEDLKHYPHPVTGVSWYEAVEFCNRMSARDGLEPAYTLSADGTVQWKAEANGYRLPTEAEWEYAARAGQQTRYSGSDRIEDVAWYSDNTPGEPRQVGTRNPNAWGLHDMSGNVWEWCWDTYGEVSTDSVVDPNGPSVGRYRVGRGGSYVSAPLGGVRVADRERFDAGVRYKDLGFRIARNGE